MTDVDGDGSSTESEYYEDADDQELVWDAPAADFVNVQPLPVAAAAVDSSVNASSVARNTNDTSSCSAGGELASNAQQKPTTHSKPDEGVLQTSTRSIEIPHEGPKASSRAQTRYSESPPLVRHTIPESPSAASERSSASTCDCCSAQVVTARHTTALDRASRLCHCCKLSVATIQRNVVHMTNGLLKLRFCAACFTKSGRTFMADVRTFKPPQYMKCSGCHRSKDRNSFHARQRIFRHWEEPLNERYYCFTCLPRGFVASEDKVIPHQIRCGKCSVKKKRSYFSQWLKTNLARSEDLKLMLEQCIEDSLVVCNRCLDAKHREDRCLRCSKCKQLLERSQFPKAQQQVAREDDENTEYLPHERAFVCCNCSDGKRPSVRSSYREPAKRPREDSSAYYSRGGSQSYSNRDRDHTMSVVQSRNVVLLITNETVVHARRIQ